MNLEAARLNLGLTRIAAAKKVGVSERVLRYAESGGRPGPANAKKIADFYGVRVTDIFPLDEPEPDGVAA